MLSDIIRDEVVFLVLINHILIHVKRVMHSVYCNVGRVNIGEQSIKVAQNLPAGYLSCELTGSGRAVLQHIMLLSYQCIS